MNYIGLIRLSVIIAIAFVVDRASADPAPTKGERSIFADKQDKESPTAKPAASTKGGTAQNKPQPPADPVPTRQFVGRFNVKPEPGQSLEEAYFQFLSENEVHPKILRAKVRQIVAARRNGNRYQEVVFLLRAALRTDQMQPWMYEALGLAMEMSQMPGEEVERTLLSAADFTNHPVHLMYIAEYLERFQRYDRALDLLREVTIRAPEQTDAYIRGLDLATKQNNETAIQWASLAILRRAWPAEQRGIQDKARRSALALIADMRKREDNDAANRLAGQLRSAMIRDVVIKAEWVGEADVDLIIEEPSGSVCSYRSPRTSGGGVLVGDLNTKLDRSAGEGYSETYVCPEGFAGTYRLLLRQVWGRIPTGKVTIDVWTNGGSVKQTHRHCVVELSDDGAAIVAFGLDKGRRVDSLERNQLDNDIRGQLAVNRAVLARQIDAIASSRAIRAQQISGPSPGQSPFVAGGTPFLNRPNGNAVGFQPEIAVLPVGATMSVNAVISADRRYVRITALPFFSNIRAVVQFNLQTGVDPMGMDADLGQLDIDIDNVQDIDFADVDAQADLGGGVADLVVDVGAAP